MPRRPHILVIGYNDDGCTPEHEKVAYDAGQHIARSGAVLITGGLGGVMRAACRGSHDAGGLAVGIIPQSNHSPANEFCDVVIPTGLGLTRDFVNALTADGVIIIGGGAGTLSEVCAAYMHRRPMVAIGGTGGTAERVAGQYMDHRKKIMVQKAGSAQEAVDVLIGQLHGL